jgi:hypothetical protein
MPFFSTIGSRSDGPNALRFSRGHGAGAWLWRLKNSKIRGHTIGTMLP